jgi:hypothetical protein
MLPEDAFPVQRCTTCESCQNILENMMSNGHGLFDIVIMGTRMTVVEHPALEPAHQVLLERITMRELGELATAISRVLPDPARGL